MVLINKTIVLRQSMPKKFLLVSSSSQNQTIPTNQIKHLSPPHLHLASFLRIFSNIDSVQK